jgi:hypothetical protein
MDKITLRKVKILVESEHWDVISVVFDEIKKKWNAVPVKGETEWETLWNVATKEAKIEGVAEFINSIEQLTHND